MRILTDIQRFKDLFTDVGVGFVEEGFPKIGGVCNNPKENHLILGAGTERVEGYPGFEAVFRFDLEGQFIEAGVWE